MNWNDLSNTTINFIKQNIENTAKEMSNGFMDGFAAVFKMIRLILTNVGQSSRSRSQIQSIFKRYFK